MMASHGLIGIAIALAASQSPSSDPQAAPVRAGDVTKADAEALIARCGPRKFETEVLSNNGGKLRKAKILLCARPADSDEQWISTLDKAAAQIEASPQLSAEAKSKVIGEIQAAIGRVRGAAGARAEAGGMSLSPTAGAAGTAGTAGTAGGAVGGLVSRAPPPMPDPIVATVRPLPPPLQPKPVATPRLPVAKPQLSISCAEAGDPGGGGGCSGLSAATLLTVRAEADVTSRASLRFVRDGDPRGDVALGTMRRGQIIRSRLPARVCAGVVRGRVIIQTIVTHPQNRTEQIADSQGPLLLRC